MLAYKFTDVVRFILYTLLIPVLLKDIYGSVMLTRHSKYDKSQEGAYLDSVTYTTELPAS